MTKMADSDGLGEKLDILIKLTALSMVEQHETQKDKIIFLHKVGMTPKQIGDILQTSPNSVSVTLSKFKKSGTQNGDAKG
jgi:DNA-binding CsgD family transcriptional regulator